MRASLNLIRFYGARLYAGFLDPWFPRLLALAAKFAVLHLFLSPFSEDGMFGWGEVRWVGADWLLISIVFLIVSAVLSELPPFWKWRDQFDTLFRMIWLALLFFWFGLVVGTNLENEAAQREELPISKTIGDKQS